MAVKIMRRAGLGPRQGSAGGSTQASSSAPSKATSEAGLETNSEEGILSPDTPNKDKSKLTREEREAQYKAARERIFGDFQESVTSENASTGDNSASLSRSSSSSGRRKTRKNKTPKDDSFEARSAYIPSYASMQMPNMQHHYQPQYSDYQASYLGSNNAYGAGINYGTTPTPSYPNFEPSVPYNTMAYGSSNSQQYNAPDSWSSMPSATPNGYMNYSSSPTSSYQQGMPPMMAQMNGQYMQQPQPAMQPPSNWMNNQWQGSYNQPSAPAASNINGWPGNQQNPGMNNTGSYGFGHVGGQNYGTNPAFNAQHPMQDNYSRSLFNPQTRSFVPNTATSRTGGRNGKKKPLPSSNHNRVNNGPRPFGSDISGASTLSSSRGFDTSSTLLKEDSLQQKYGAPAHLPKKPPPSQVLSSYDVETMTNTAGAVPLNYSTSPPNGGPPT
jgi:hypothetical protein